MAKRKLGASIVILCIAAITLISGTYAWFLVGGFASLFDIGFDVIESGAGIEIKGDAATATWKNELVREDFADFSFIAENGKYKPVSSANGVDFIAVGMENNDFKSNGVPANKTNATTATDICYNDFTFFVRSTGEESVGGSYMTIELSGKTVDEDGNVVNPADANDKGAAVAGRVAVTVDADNDGTAETTIYAIDNEQTNAVTSTFGDGVITDTLTIPAENRGNQIIDSGDTGYAAAALVPANPTALFDEDENLIHINLGNIPGTNSSNYSTGKQVTIRIWLEGNDLQCVDKGDNAIPGKSLMTQIKFVSE